MAQVNDARLVIRLPQAGKDKVTVLATQEQRPVAQMARILIDEALDARARRM